MFQHMSKARHPESVDLDLPRILHALSDPGRLEMLSTLADGVERTCGELGSDQPKSSASHHFRILRDAGLIRTRVKGTNHYNSLRTEEVEARFPGLLDAVLSAWRTSR
ncbi:MAG: bacterial regulatory, arsR family protein [Phycisphaerales bacterium]|nr:bacterial regulatory, arsR family protein [Phycisphaerales bacterium]